MKKSMKYSLSALAVFGFGAVWSSQAAGYNILLQQVHETITRAAVDCVTRADGALPAQCALDRKALKALRRGNASEFKEHVRWADNPLRQNNLVSGAHALVNTKLGRCLELLERNAANIQNAGLPCRTHFGDLQFWHAMRSSATETPVETRGKILSWARFNYHVAQGHVKPDDSFCGQFGGKTDFDAAMVPPAFPYCDDSDDPWTVGEFYTFYCSTNPMECGKSTADVRHVAIGAILHMIQDSYSQTHALRTDSPVRNKKGRLAARAECGKPRYYEHFNELTSKTHDQADKWPELVPCGESAEADDVITASARAIYHARNSSEAAFMQYLEDSVF